MHSLSSSSSSLSAPDFETEQLSQRFVALSTHHRSVIDQLRAKTDSLLAVDERLETLPKKLSHPVLVPLVDDLAFVPGRIVRANEVLCLLGDGYFVWRTAHDARGIVERRLERLEQDLRAEEQKLRQLNAQMGLITSIVTSGDDGVATEGGRSAADEVEDDAPTMEIKEEEEEALQRERAVRGQSYQVVRNKQVDPAADDFDEMFEKLALEEAEAEESGEEIDAEELEEFNKFFRNSGDEERAVKKMLDVPLSSSSSSSGVDAKRRVKFSEAPPDVRLISDPVTQPAGSASAEAQKHDRHKTPRQASNAFTGMVVERQESAKPLGNVTGGERAAPKKKMSRFRQRMMGLE